MNTPNASRLGKVPKSYLGRYTPGAGELPNATAEERWRLRRETLGAILDGVQNAVPGAESGYRQALFGPPQEDGGQDVYAWPPISDQEILAGVVSRICTEVNALVGDVADRHVTNPEHLPGFQPSLVQQ